MSEVTAEPDPVEPPGYPARWTADVVLSDGATMHIRPIRPDDADAISALHGRLSRQTVYLRFFTPVTTLPAKMLQRFTHVDYVDRLALVGVLAQQIIAVARYERLPAEWAGAREAEVAFLVDDAHQGRGIGTVMLEHLAGAAKEAGISRFVADTLPENSRMLRVFHEAGFDDVRTFADGVVRVAFPIAPTPASQAASHDRERRAAARSVGRLLAPKGIAVVGASRRQGTLGHVLVRMALAGDFAGPVYPVNPEAEHVAGVKAYPSVLDIPDAVDLAVIVAPADAVRGIVEQCARKRVGGLVIVSAGFAETGEDGAAVERALVHEARGNGMRLVGPASMGVVNTDPAVRLNTTFSPMPPRGRIGFVAQSGGLGVVILDEVARRGLGISTFVSAGNKGDVSSNDLLQYWDEDPATDVVCAYIESFGNPRTFARVARRVSRRKPIVAVKSGRSAAGTRAAGIHRPSQSDESVDALFRQAGVIRTDTIEELFDVAQILASQPLPGGRRVALVGSSGGPGVLAADACATAGLEIASLSPATCEHLRGILPSGQPVHNPVALRPDAHPEDFRRAIGAVSDDEAVDAVIALYTTPVAAPVAEIAAAITAAARAHPDKPILACVLGRRGLIVDGSPGNRSPGNGSRGNDQAIPSFPFPEAAARALGMVAGYADWVRRPPGTLPELAGLDPAAARAVVSAALGPGPVPAEAGGAGGGGAAGGGAGGAGVWLDPDRAAGLLAAYRIPVLPRVRVASGRQATAAARQIGYPVALRTDPTADGALAQVRLGLGTQAAVRDAFAELIAGETGPVSVQAMAGAGSAATVGITQDPLFGPLVTLGISAGLGDRPRGRAGRIAPLTDRDAAELAAEALGRARLDGSVWTEPERTAVEDVLLRAGRLAEDLPELAELEINPLIVTPALTAAGGFRARVAPWAPRPELALRHLN